MNYYLLLSKQGKQLVIGGGLAQTNEPPILRQLICANNVRWNVKVDVDRVGSDHDRTRFEVRELCSE